MNISRLALLLMRIGAGIQLVLGVAFWTGHWSSAVPAHKTIGVVYVLCLWIIAVIALAKRANTGLAVFAVVWGLVIAGFGFAQTHMMVGGTHWIIRVVHLAIALAAMPLAERFARAPTSV